MVKKKKQETFPKVINIGKIRQEKEKKGSLIALLKDTRKAALAIKHKTCLHCQTKKMCVNITGLCSSCYGNLTPEEKVVADKEAQHKIIEIKVKDDRWKNKNDP